MCVCVYAYSMCVYICAYIPVHVHVCIYVTFLKILKEKLEKIF